MIKPFFDKITLWLDCARVWSLPITFLNWLAAFVYSIMHGGNILYGFVALAGITFAHLAANLTDDYFDYKILSAGSEFINSAQNCKCIYLKTNQITLSELKLIIVLFLGIAACAGAFLFFASGYYVALLALAGLLIVLTYQKFSVCGAGELAVFVAFGPLLYEGTFYSMTGHFSAELLILSMACVSFTIAILYTHMLLDYDGDECSHKKTLCRFFKSKENALKFLPVFYLTGYVIILLVSFLERNFMYLLTLLTFPLVVDLYKSLKKFNEDKTTLPQVRFWHFPLDNWKETSLTPDAPFYFRIFYVRNITTLFILLSCAAMILGK